MTSKRPVHALPKTLCLMALGAAALFVSACAPVIRNGPPSPLWPALMETARIDTILVSTGWLNVEDDFVDTFSDEVREELEHGASGRGRGKGGAVARTCEIVEEMLAAARA